MKTTLTALLIIFYLNVSAQVVNKFDLVVNDNGKPVITIKPDGTMFVSDSLKAIQILYRELLNEKKQKDMLAKQIFDAIIENKKKNTKSITISKKQRS